MKKYYLTIFICCLLILLTACDNRFGSISGKVAVNYTGQGLQKGIVETFPPTSVVSTDLDGFYKIENVPPGFYTVKVSFGKDPKGDPLGTYSTQVEVLPNLNTNADMVITWIPQK